MVGRPHRDRGRGHPLTSKITKRRRALLVAASASYAFGLWWMTLRPSIYDAGTASVLDTVVSTLRSWQQTAWVTLDLVEFVANVALFVPLGMLVIAWRGRWWHGILIAVLTSALIETIQLLFLPTRVADVRDLVANTAGAMIGVALALAASRLHSDRISVAIESS
uniref:VanZ family protein n=1 Tax=Microbacterium sp. SORGH_AS_1204 TaxID=3041785 RepID=UPI0027D8C504|nr:VanZ family protein [Microbacterium sp. SORGH_AS_1204]